MTTEFLMFEVMPFSVFFYLMAVNFQNLCLNTRGQVVRRASFQVQVCVYMLNLYSGSRKLENVIEKFGLMILNQSTAKQNKKLPSDVK